MDTQRSLFRSALWLALSLVSSTLLLLPFALGRVGANGVFGLLGAAGLLLLCGWTAAAIVVVTRQPRSPVGTLLAMAIRMLPPLAVCATLALQGAHGRDYLPFICYLLVLYGVALAVETCIAVRRVAGPFSDVADPVR